MSKYTQIVLTAIDFNMSAICNIGITFAMPQFVTDLGTAINLRYLETLFLFMLRYHIQDFIMN